MNRIQSLTALTAILAFLLPAGSALAQKAYTPDTQEISLRNTPNSKGKVLLSIPPASAVELVNPNSYTMVRYKTPSGETREGWVQSRLLSPRPPDSTLALQLGSENTALKDRVGALDMDKAALMQREKELTDKLTKLNAAYEELKSGSANYVKLKSEYDSSRASLASAQENIQTLIQENESLKLSQRVQWFVAGALVLILGWFMGWATGRRQRKRGTYYY